MAPETSIRLIVVGFAMAYVGAMGFLLMLSSVNLSEEVLRAVRLALGGLFVSGSLVVLIGRLAPVRER